MGSKRLNADLNVSKLIGIKYWYKIAIKLSKMRKVGWPNYPSPYVTPYLPITIVNQDKVPVSLVLNRGPKVRRFNTKLTLIFIDKFKILYYN